MQHTCSESGLKRFHTKVLFKGWIMVKRELGKERRSLAGQSAVAMRLVGQVEGEWKEGTRDWKTQLSAGRHGEIGES